MKRSTLNLALLVLAIAFAPLRSWAQPTAAPPGQLSYQGFLTDANGIPLSVQFQDPVMVNIQGLSPVIREISPVNATNMPVFAALIKN